MPYRPEAELKRPDLKGEFLCGHCGKTFCHAASLNRHRLNFHGDDQQCQLCHVKIAANETVRRHMSQNHQITRVFTCGCCNWTFPDKKELHAHNNSMMRTGQPGDARAIAISNRAPGSLAQAELRSEGSSSPPSISHVSPAPKQSRKKVDGNSVAEMFCSQLMSQSPFAGMPAEWMSAFIMNNPSLLPLIANLQHPQVVAPKKEETVASTSTMDMLLKSINNNNNNNNNSSSKYDELCVKTEQLESSSGPESGIASGEEVTDSSPIPSDSSTKESSPSMSDDSKPTATNPRKRKSLDAIASFLSKRQQQPLV